MICSEGLIDLGLDTPGLREIHGDGIAEVNPLFRNFGKDKRVSGYGISSPGQLYKQVLARRKGTLSQSELERTATAMNLGFYATLSLEGAEKSLDEGEQVGRGTTLGATIDLRKLAVEELGREVAAQYRLA